MIVLCCETCHRIAQEDELVNYNVEVDGMKSTIVGLRCPTCKDYRCAIVYSRSDKEVNA